MLEEFKLPFLSINSITFDLYGNDEDYAWSRENLEVGDWETFLYLTKNERLPIRV